MQCNYRCTLIFYWKKEGLFSDLEWSQTTQLFLNGCRYVVKVRKLGLLDLFLLFLLLNSSIKLLFGGRKRAWSDLCLYIFYWHLPYCSRNFQRPGYALNCSIWHKKYPKLAAAVNHLLLSMKWKRMWGVHFVYFFISSSRWAMQHYWEAGIAHRHICFKEKISLSFLRGSAFLLFLLVVSFLASAMHFVDFVFCLLQQPSDDTFSWVWNWNLSVLASLLGPFLLLPFVFMSSHVVFYSSVWRLNFSWIMILMLFMRSTH